MIKGGHCSDPDWRNRVGPNLNARITDMEDGFSLIHLRQRFPAPFSEPQRREGGLRLYVITFGLAGESAYHSRCSSVTAPFKSGCVTFASYQDVQGRRQFNATKNLEQVRLAFSADRLEQYLGTPRMQRIAHLLCRNKDTSVLLHRRTSEAELISLQALRASQADPLSRRIQALTLLAETLRQTALIDDVCDMQTEDIRKLERAVDLMQSAMEQPLSIAFLSAQVGMSEYRFKTGFRRYFGVSPGRKLLELKMQRAKALLQAGKQVTWTAYTVGYRHPENFSASFRKYYGYSPRER
ncbi:AraC family transcriptional regulator [Hahella sp. CR1]|uniref:helix-turn-helix transcriptional regulator n=1 Tax=Hahella sp. CR1 TaxID=2992807 RepID=UPI002442AAE2|nr:AraC family transcriptional regulator [Hahella sp. CR1]MDG9670610.1 AraC family transcriptional regulator [Hahella sp. CR1]